MGLERREGTTDLYITMQWLQWSQAVTLLVLYMWSPLQTLRVPVR